MNEQQHQQHWDMLIGHLGSIAQLLGRISNDLETQTFGLQSPSVAFSALPASPSAGMLLTVNDSNTNVWGAVIAAGGANVVLAFFNGTNWTVAGK